MATGNLGDDRLDQNGVLRASRVVSFRRLQRPVPCSLRADRRRRQESSGTGRSNGTGLRCWRYSAGYRGRPRKSSAGNFCGPPGTSLSIMMEHQPEVCTTTLAGPARDCAGAGMKGLRAPSAICAAVLLLSVLAGAQQTQPAAQAVPAPQSSAAPKQEGPGDPSGRSATRSGDALRNFISTPANSFRKSSTTRLCAVTRRAAKLDPENPNYAAAVEVVRATP